MGKTSAKEATALGARNAAEIGRGYDSADQYSKTGYETSQSRYAPYAEGGQKGYTAYNDALGLNGSGAQQQQYQNFQADPFQQYSAQNTGNQLNALFKRYGAQGMANSGASGLAVSRVAGENARTDVNNWLTRLQGVGNQGVQTAGAQAGLDQNYYGGAAERAVGRSTALVGNDTQATQAANNARMSGVNNLMKVAGGAAQLAMGMPPTSWAGGGTQQGGTSPGGVAPGGTWGQPNPYYAAGGGW